VLISHIVRPENITSDKQNAVPGDPFRVDGNPFDLQIVACPGAWGFTIYVSEDGVNWVIGTDADAVALTGLVYGDYRIVRERPMWVMATVAADAFSPRIHVWVLGVRKQI